MNAAKISALLLRDVEIAGQRRDVRIAEGVIDAIGDHLEGADVTLNGDGGALIPGLHDHHVHLLAAAAAARSVTVGPPEVRDERQLRARLAESTRTTSPGEWIRAVGYHDSVAGPLDRWRLDALCPDRPLRVQHRSGALWVLNSAALRAAGINDESAAGRFFRRDDWLRERVPPVALNLQGIGSQLASFGVVGITDATPYRHAGELAAIAEAVAGNQLRIRVTITGAPGIEGALPEGLAWGPAKILLPDHDLPPLDDIEDLIREARRHDRPVAVHCVTREWLLLTLAALEAVGVRGGDRIEHGSLVPTETVDDLARLRLCVVTQPGFVATRGDEYLTDVDARDLPDLWRCRSLLDAGVAVAAGTDAPFGSLDPWRAVAAAVDRRTTSGETLGPDERVTAEQALQLFLGPALAPGGPPRRIEAGARADLCLLDRPLSEALRTPNAEHVRATIVAGRIVFGA